MSAEATPALQLPPAADAELQSYIHAHPMDPDEPYRLQELQHQRFRRGAQPAPAFDDAIRATDPDDAVRRWQAAQHRRASTPALRQVQASREALPAWTVREDVVRRVKAHPVVVVSGETGCGKSTQVPQFLLDDPAIGPHCNIVVTQPRRISALSLAERIAFERGEEAGGTVGYSIRLETRRSARTQLLLCTAGVLLRRLTIDPLLRDVTHVVLGAWPRTGGERALAR